MNMNLSLLRLVQTYRAEQTGGPTPSASMGGFLLVGGLLIALLIFTFVVWLASVILLFTNWSRLPTWAKIMCVLCVFGTFVSDYGVLLSILCLIIIYSSRGPEFGPQSYYAGTGYAPVAGSPGVRYPPVYGEQQGTLI